MLYSELYAERPELCNVHPEDVVKANFPHLTVVGAARDGRKLYACEEGEVWVDPRIEGTAIRQVIDEDDYI